MLGDPQHEPSSDSDSYRPLSPLLTTMTKLACPDPSCTWESQDFPPELAVAANTALELHARLAHAPNQPPQASANSAIKLKPPHISAGTTPDQWSAFKMSIQPAMYSTVLFHCCDDDLMTDIMRDHQGDVASMPEPDLLAAIKRLAVTEESTLVHRIRLGKMTQAPTMPIRTFLANLKGQASPCQYVATCKEQGCNHEYDFSSEIIKDNLIRGIADPEILSDILGDSKTDRTLGETVAFIAQKEQGKATRAAVGDSTSSMSQSLTKPESHQPISTEPAAKCWACGEAKHGATNDRNSRAKHCKAWSSTCSNF